MAKDVATDTDIDMDIDMVMDTDTGREQLNIHVPKSRDSPNCKQVL